MDAAFLAWRLWVPRVLGSLVLLALLWVSPLWAPLQCLEHDLLAGFSAPAHPPVGVVVVAIDEASLSSLGLAPPLPRHLHARMLQALAGQGVAAVGWDLLFSAPQTPQDDAVLAQALQGSLPVVLASIDVDVQSTQLQQYRQRVESIFAGARHGNVAMPVDADGVVRRLPDADDAFWRVLAQAAGRKVRAPPPGALLRHYAPEAAVPTVHYVQALDAAQALPPGALRGKIVLVGQDTPVDGVDRLRTPLHVLGEGTQAGVRLHATALANALAGDWVVPAPPAGPWLQALLVLLALALHTRVWRGRSAALWSLALAGAAVLGSGVAYLAGMWWTALPTLAMLALHLNVGAASSYWQERQGREALRREFAQYLPVPVVDQLVHSGFQHTRSERRELSLLFADLAGFTQASEAMPVQQVADALDAYFSRMTDCVHRHGGTLDKFIGDAVMAFWNAPLPDAAHARNALACALDMQTAMQELRALWRGTPFAQVQLRIGLHTGEAAVGHLGSQARFTYTAVGDAVNTASRLEGANKALGTPILLSGALRDAARAAGWTQPLLWLDTVRLAGRSAGIDVYTPCDDAALADIAQGLRQAVQSGQWAQAQECCAAWRAHGGQGAAPWRAQAERWKHRLQEAERSGQGGQPLPPTPLDKV
ncbi:MAG TPA: adenylate/guanylate cyclase domain-containing protein [Giesbergeria sp.]|nr:adenylate/guanylate cyclase domain-containing protein [Giesbergeria sp.]